MMERKRLTSPHHKMLGFHVYAGPQNPYSVPLILGELCLSDIDTMPKYSARKILDEVFARLAEYEDGTEKVAAENESLTIRMAALSECLEKAEEENAQLRAALFCGECGGTGEDGWFCTPCPTCGELREQLRRDE